MRDEEHKPKVLLYPRDPSLDPQLVWKGKDEQDSKDLAVPAVPIYIQVSTRKRDVRDGKVDDMTRQPGQIRAFRDTWELGIHSYLAYWRDRLVVARELLTETGSIFVQIGDENVHLVRSLLDEVFGSENFVSNIACLKYRFWKDQHGWWFMGG